MPPLLTSLSSRGVLTITLNRPEKHNALDAGTLNALHAALLDVEGNDAVRVIVLTGAGTSFCAGADIAHMRSMLNATEEQNVEDARLVAQCMRALDEVDRPVIARVNGNVFGGGVGLVACADIAIGVRDAKFALSEVRLGIVPATISPYVIAAIGPRQARRLFVTGMSFDANDALSLGLLHAIAERETLDDTTNQYVDAILQGGPHAVRAAKSLVRAVYTTEQRELLPEETSQLLAKLRVSDEGREGLSAFLERRKPNWRDK